MALRFTTLTRPAIRKLAAGEKLGEHGITAVRLADGDVRYAVGVMVDGQRIHRVIGLGSAGVTRTQCEEFIEAKRTEARAGRLALPRRRKLALNLAAAATRYVDRLESGNGKNIRVKRRQLRMYLKPHFGALRLDAVSESSVESYKKKRKDQGASNGTINRELTTLSHLFYCAVEWRWLDRIPLRIGKHLLAESEGRIIALDEAQCDALMRAALAGGHPDLWLFVAFGLNTAMRHDEIMNARWEYLNLATRRLFIPQAKAGKREQPITVELAQILEQERASRDDREGWIFPSPHTGTITGRRGNLRRPFAKAVKAAGLDPVVTPHVMRHTAITKLVQEGRDTPTIQKISGHKTFAMVLRYVHVHGQHIDDAIKAIGRGLPASPANIGGHETGMPAEHNYTGITHVPSPSPATRTKKPAIS